MVKYLGISSYIRKPFLIYDFATAPLLNFLIYEENLIFFFISVERKIKVLIKYLAIFFLFPSKEFLPISFKVQLLETSPQKQKRKLPI
jgi:hypothetical protein